MVPLWSSVALDSGEVGTVSFLFGFFSYKVGCVFGTFSVNTACPGRFFLSFSFGYFK